MLGPVRVGILGYGVIGKRVADAVRLQPDMEVTGVAIRGTSPSLQVARRIGYQVFDATASNEPSHADCDGTLTDLMKQIDVLLDCTPSGVPAAYQAIYEAFPAVPVIVQGGEKHRFGGVSFNAFANYQEVASQPSDRPKRVRVISCSSTGSTRMVWALHRAFGLERGFISLWRRAADPGKSSKTPVNALTPYPGQSHHAPDVGTVLPGLNLYSMSADCPTTLSHVLTIEADLARAPSMDEVRQALDRTPRIILGSGLRSTHDLAEYYQDIGRSRRDRPEVYVWDGGLHVQERTIVASFNVHMESITIPETIDCVRATLGMEADPWVSIRRTDTALGIEKEAAYYAPTLR
jgi:glyceraldehyde-3-phosphate dehydrogenase (NAD(P))